MQRRAPPRALAAICAVAMMTLVLQIALTRILSATVSHHAAFAVIGLVMLGLATSAAVVFVQRNRAERPATLSVCANALLAAGVGCSASSLMFTGLMALPWGSQQNGPALLAGVPFFALFFLAGYGIAFLLAEYAEDAARLYWLDLTGAAAGCALVIPLLDVGSPLVTVAWCGVLVSGGGYLLTRDPSDGRTGLGGGVVLLTLIVAVSTTAFPELTRLRHAKGMSQDNVLWEQWNRLSRVTVHDEVPGYDHQLARLRAHYPDADAEQILDRWRMGWGMSELFTGDVPEMRWVELDTDAGTQIVEGGGRDYGDRLEYLEYDVTTVAYQLRSEGLERAFVVGGGGGRDVLTALHFGVEEVDVAELNPSVVEAVDEAFGDYGGHVYSLPGVHTHIGEARSILSRKEERYDVIQMSMIDTWAASVAGALVLSENALYTREAFELYLDHLQPDGLFTVSRWASDARWGEAARTLALMGAALRRHGATDPATHVAVVQAGGQAYPGVATCIMKPTPFSDAERRALAEATERLGFELIWPLLEGEPVLDVPAVMAGDRDAAYELRLDLRAPTDDRPFFFELRPMLTSWLWALQDRDLSVASRSMIMTGLLLLIYPLVGRILMLEPLQRYNASLPEAERTQLRAHLPAVTYFAMIGLGFLFVEVAILQRYMTFLGHPTYAMSVVLFSLLLSSGAGASMSDWLSDPARIVWPLGALLVGIALTAFAVPPLLVGLHHLDLAVRMVVAIALVVPLGLCMGMMFPLGVRMLHRDGVAHLLPWLWSVNGIFGVMASVVGIIVAMSQGYTAVLGLGAVCYVGMGVAARRSWRVGLVEP